MAYLFIDDERYPKTDKDWIIVRTYKEAINYMKMSGLPDYISFDHDLGEGQQTGYQIAKWIDYAIRYRMIEWNPKFEFNVHSANPVGSKNIQARLNTLINLMNIGDKIAWLNKNYPGNWHYNYKTRFLEDLNSEKAFLPQDI